LHHLDYHKLVPLGILPILILILMANSHAELEKNDTKIIYPSNNSKVQTGNLTLNGAPSENETKLSNQQLNMKLNQPSKNNDVFSGSNFEIMIPTDKANNSETELQSDDKFNRIFRADNTSTSPKNDTHITATPPSILEIGSNQNSNSSGTNFNKSQLFADAGKDQTVYEGTTVLLNGSNSKSNESIILSYAWKQIPNPIMTIGGANTMLWSFIAPNVSTDTTFTFELTVTDNKGVTSIDNVNIIVRDTNSLPNEVNKNNQLVADAGQDQIIEEGSLITLEGKSISSKPNDNISFQWIQIGNSTNTINAPIWSFKAPFVESDTIIPFQLVVKDSEENKALDMIDVLVKNSNSSLEYESNNLVLQTLLDKNPISRGEKQILKIDVFDGGSDDKIEGAKISGHVMDPSKKIKKEFSMNNARARVTLNIADDAKVGIYIVSVNASAPGYSSANMDTNFKVQK
jgi:hypothetical protein